MRTQEEDYRYLRAEVRARQAGERKAAWRLFFKAIFCLVVYAVWIDVVIRAVAGLGSSQ